MKKINVAKGTDIILIDADKFKTNYISFNFMLPLSKDTAAENALVPFVLKRGCAGYEDITALNKHLEQLYGAVLDVEVSKKGEAQVITIGIEFIKKNHTLNGESLLEDALDILLAVIFEPVASPQYIESEKKNLLDKYNARVNDKRLYAIERLYENMCADEAFGVNELGDDKTILQLDNNSFERAHNNIINHAQLAIVLIGEFDVNYIKTKTEKYFNNRNEIFDINTYVKNSVENVREFSDKFDVEQAKLSMGFRILNYDTEERAVLNVFNAIYGATATSKLFLNVREKLSLCYYCATRIERMKSMLVVYSGIEEKNKDKAISEVLKQLEAMKKGEITPDEIQVAKTALENSFKSAMDSISTMEDYYTGQLLCKKIVTLEESIDMLKNVSKQDIINLADKIELDSVYMLSAEKQ